MGTPKNTKNIGKYWENVIKIKDEDIYLWVNSLNINNLYFPFTNKSYKTIRGFLSIVNRKLDHNSSMIFNYYFRKIVLKQNQCTLCDKEIEKDFIVSLPKRSMNRLPKWCENHYKEKKWLEDNGKHSKDANVKRSKSRIKFLKTIEGKIYSKNVGEFNKINTKKWKSKLTLEQKEVINIKSSISQTKNILDGKFNPQKNYKHFNKNKCYINNNELIFRSSWEVVFFISHSYLKYETLRIKYVKFCGKRGVYIPDFIDDVNKIVYELKPRRNYLKQQLKMDAGINWCLKNDYKFIWINEDNLLDYINIKDNTDKRNNIFYEKVIKGINGNLKNKINKENR
jgi:hypothetical protein